MERTRDSEDRVEQWFTNFFVLGPFFVAGGHGGPQGYFFTFNFTE